MRFTRRDIVGSSGTLLLAGSVDLAAANGATPVVTPDLDGPLLLYQTFAPGTTYFALATSSADGTGGKIIASEGNLGAKHAQWSRDGSKIAFINHFDGSIW
jgi:hypothetical protein